MVGSQAQREAVGSLVKEYKVSERRACRAIKGPRATVRYAAKESALNKKLKVEIISLANRHPRDGSPRIYPRIKRSGFEVNHKRVERLYYKVLDLGLNRKRKSKKRLRSASRIKLPYPLGINEFWSMDFVSDRFTNGGRFRTLTVQDMFTRECIAVEPSRSYPLEQVVEVLKKIEFTQGRLPKALRVDNGPEMIAKVLDEFCYKKGIKLEFIDSGKPYQNGFIESFNGKFRDECLNMHYFYNLEHAGKKLRNWQWEYNYDRPHSSLNGKTPKEFAREQLKAKCA